MSNIEKAFFDGTFHQKVGDLLWEKGFSVSLSDFSSSVRQVDWRKPRFIKKWRSALEFSKNNHDFRLILTSSKSGEVPINATIEIKVKGLWRNAQSKSEVFHHGELDEIEGILRQL